MLDHLQGEFPAYTPRPANAPKALEGVRVVDFTHFIAGPLATTVLADMGADVIKVEATGRGDEFRYYPPVLPDLAGRGAPHMWTNRNKRSLAVDLKTPEGLEIARELIRGADIVAENFSAGVMQRFGLDYEHCKALNPKLIYCAVSAYGRDGAFADRLGFDPIAQAESGFISMNGYPDRQGVRTLSPVVDISTAMIVSNAMLGALLARQRTGTGQYIEVALFDVAVTLTGYAAQQHLFTGDEPQRHGNTSPDTCPSGVFMSADKPFYINCGNSKIFDRLMRHVLEREDLANDPVLADRDGRVANRDMLFTLMEDEFKKKPWSHWQPRMREASIPCGEVRTVGEALRSPEAQARRLVSLLPHPETGVMPYVASPIRMEQTPVVDPTPAPAVGEHSEAILKEVLGYTNDQIAALRSAKVIQQYS